MSSCNREVAEALAGAVLTGHVAPALPAPRPLALQGTTRASPVALPLHPTIPVTSTNPTMPSRAQDCASAPAELRSSAVAFTPGEKVHMTPVKVSTPAAEDEDELCAWLREKACLHKVVIERSLGKLHTEDVYDVAGLSVLHTLGGLKDVFSRVAASQIASALDRLTISNTEPAPPAGLTTPPPRAASTAAVQGITGRGIVFDAAPESQQPEAAAENDRKETASLPEPTRTQMGGNGRTPIIYIRARAGRRPPTGCCTEQPPRE